MFTHLDFLKKENYCKFLDRIFDKLAEEGIDVSSFDLDHICYRVETLSRFSEIKQALKNDHRILGENLVNGRPIINFQLTQPLTYKTRKIHILEIPAPKIENAYHEGYEHVEFVTEGSLEDFIEQYSNIDFDKNGFHKSVNRDLRLKWNDISVKFHETSLKEVILAERG